MRPIPALLAALLALACAAEPTQVQLTLVPAEAIGCQPTEVQSVVLRPLGDAPTEARPSLRLELDRVSRIESFPPSTERVSVTAEGIIERFGGSREAWTGGGMVVFDGRSELVVPLLRFRRACPLADTRAGVPEGASVVPLPDGRLAIAGGDRASVDLRLVVVRPGDRVATTVDVDARNRVAGTATPLGGDRLLLAGGYSRESYEVIRVDEESIPSEGLLPRGPRAEHGAVRLPDGRALLVGGRSGEGGAARADAEIVELNADGLVTEVRRANGSLAQPRVAPVVLALDDGTVLVLGGVDEAGAPIATVERFDPDTESFTSFEPWSARAHAAYVALEGGRVARVGGLDGEAWSRGVSILLERGETHVPLGGVLHSPLERPRAVALGDGRLLVVGALEGAPATQVIDPGATRDDLETSLGPVVAARIPTDLVRLSDGTIAELDADGLSLLRLDNRSPFDDPSASISPVQVNQRAELSLDAIDRWRGEGELLVATVDGARFDLPTSRFASLGVELEAEGPHELLLTVDGEEPLVIAVDAEARIGDGGCRIPVTGPLVVERERSRLQLRSGPSSVTCTLSRDVDRVGVAVRAQAGSGVRRLAVTRR